MDTDFLNEELRRPSQMMAVDEVKVENVQKPDTGASKDQKRVWVVVISGARESCKAADLLVQWRISARGHLCEEEEEKKKKKKKKNDTLQVRLSAVMLCF